MLVAIVLAVTYKWYYNAQYMAREVGMNIRANFATMNAKFDYSTDDKIKITLYLPIVTYKGKPAIGLVKIIVEEERKKYASLPDFPGIAKNIQSVELVDTEYGPMLKYQTNYKVSHIKNGFSPERPIDSSKIGLCPFLGRKEDRKGPMGFVYKTAETMIYADFPGDQLFLSYGMSFGYTVGAKTPAWLGGHGGSLHATEYFHLTAPVQNTKKKFNITKKGWQVVTFNVGDNILRNKCEVNIK